MNCKGNNMCILTNNLKQSASRTIYLVPNILPSWELLCPIHPHLAEVHPGIIFDLNNTTQLLKPNNEELILKAASHPVLNF